MLSRLVHTSSKWWSSLCDIVLLLNVRGWKCKYQCCKGYLDPIGGTNVTWRTRNGHSNHSDFPGLLNERCTYFCLSPREGATWKGSRLEGHVIQPAESRCACSCNIKPEVNWTEEVIQRAIFAWSMECIGWCSIRHRRVELAPIGSSVILKERSNAL